MKTHESELIVKVPFSALIDITSGVNGRKTSFASPDGKIYNLIDGKFVTESDIEKFDFKQHSEDNFDDFYEVNKDVSGELPKGSMPKSHYHSSNLSQLIGVADVACLSKPTPDELKKMSETISRVVSACITLYGRDCFKKDRDIPEDVLKDSFDHTKFENRKLKYYNESEYFVKRFMDNYLPYVRGIKPEFIVEKAYVESGEIKDNNFELKRTYGGTDNILYSLPDFYINEDAEEKYKHWMDVLKGMFYSEYGDKQYVRELKNKNIEVINSECVVDNITGREKASEEGGAEYVSGERLTIVYTAKVSAIRQKCGEDIIDYPTYDFVAIDPEFINDAIKAGVMIYGKSFLNANDREQREAFINTFISSYNKNESLFVENSLFLSGATTYHIDVRNLDIKKVLVSEFVQKVLPDYVGKVYSNSSSENPVSDEYVRLHFGTADNFLERVYSETKEMAETKRLNIFNIERGDEE